MVIMPRREAKGKEANMTWFLYKTKIMNAQFILSLSITFSKGFYDLFAIARRILLLLLFISNKSNLGLVAIKDALFFSSLT